MMGSNRSFIPTSLAKNLEPLNYPDCVHVTINGKCKVLRISKCKGKHCSFCCNDKQNKSSEESCRQRLSNLDREKQERIAKIYYGGKKPWRESL